ncbi:MAG: RnfABCDGE type electron transport complex subunit G [Nanobdellota archaeon]
MKNKTITQVGILTLILVTSTILLVWTNKYTEPLIKKNEENKLNDKLTTLFPEMAYSKIKDTKVSQIETMYEVYNRQNNLLGHAVVSSAYGYQSEIKLLVGFREKNKIDSVIILEQAETAGIGDKITKKGFMEQFNDLNKKQANLKKKGGEVDSITGATISSKAVVKAIEKAFEEVDK